MISSFAPSVVKFRNELIKDIIKKGYEVHVILPEKADIDFFPKVEALGAKLHLVKMQRTGMNPFADLRTVVHLLEILKSIKPDIVFTYTIKAVIYGNIAAKIAGIKSLHSLISGLGYAFIGKSLKNKIVNLISKSLYRFALSSAQTVFFQNPDDMNLFIEQKIINDKSKCTLVNGSGVDIKYFSKAPLPSETSFVLIARLLRDKGIYEYIGAVRKVKQKYPDTVFKLVGWIDSNPAAIAHKDLEAWQKENLIQYFGRLDDVREVIKDSSVFVLPSYREGTPRTVLESMSMGRAIITTDAPGCRETVIDGCNGYLVPVHDSEILAQRMLDLIENPEKLAKMAASSRKIAEDKYEVSKINQVMLDKILS